MKRIVFFVAAILLAGIFNSSYGQPDVSAKKITITYTWSRIQSRGSNQLAVWIEDQKGNHIRTLFATHFTATGGYKYRPVSLSGWTSKFDLRNATPEQVDAVSGSTPSSGKQSIVWDGRDQAGNIVPDGKYIIRMEANIHNEDMMFFKAEINVGGADQHSIGEISFSKPELANGDVLFRDVIVDYK